MCCMLDGDSTELSLTVQVVYDGQGFFVKAFISLSLASVERSLTLQITVSRVTQTVTVRKRNIWTIEISLKAVSYTHLTLPTKLEV